MRRLVRPQDKVLVATINYGNSAEGVDVLKPYKDMMAAAGSDLTVLHQLTSTPSVGASEHEVIALEDARINCGGCTAAWHVFAGVNGECINHQLERQETVSDGLLRLAKLKDIHTLVLGISGYRCACREACTTHS